MLIKRIHRDFLISLQINLNGEDRTLRK